MDRHYDRIILTTMCAIINNNGEWLFIDRKKNWKGLALPGGHIRDNESICDCALREAEEETGLILKNIYFKGVYHFYNAEKAERFIVFNFMSNSFSGNMKPACEEGDLSWIKPNDVDRSKLSDGMAERLSSFIDNDIAEHFTEWSEVAGYINTKKQGLR